MAVLRTKTGARCKLCQSPHASEMDALLEKRSNGESDEAGNRVNFEYVAARYAELHADAKSEGSVDWTRITEENVKGHWKNHCQKVTPEEAGALDEAKEKFSGERLAVFDIVLGPDFDYENSIPSVDQVLEIQRGLYVLDLRAKAGSDAPLGLTHDHAFKGADASTRRKQEEGTATLLRALGAAAGTALVQKATERRELPVGDVIEGEVVEEAEVA